MRGWAPTSSKLSLLPELRPKWAEPVWPACSSCYRHAGEPEPGKSCPKITVISTGVRTSNLSPSQSGP